MDGFKCSGWSLFSLAWAFKVPKFIVSERKCINWSWSEQKLICKE
jgi:exosortase/archaeosortase